MTALEKPWRGSTASGKDRPIFFRWFDPDVVGRIGSREVPSPLIKTWHRDAKALHITAGRGREWPLGNAPSWTAGIKNVLLRRSRAAQQRRRVPSPTITPWAALNERGGRRGRCGRCGSTGVGGLSEGAAQRAASAPWHHPAELGPSLWWDGQLEQAKRRRNPQGECRYDCAASANQNPFRRTPASVCSSHPPLHKTDGLEFQAGQIESRVACPNASN